MLLKERLMEYTREELKDIAFCLDMSKVSSLRKEKLAEKIVEKLCSESELRKRMACFTDEKINLIICACKEPQKVSSKDIINAMELYSNFMVYFDEETDYMYVLEDIAETFAQIYDEDFKKDQYKKGWLSKCIDFFILYYGIAPVEIIHKMYNLRVKSTIDEMLNTFYEMPIEYTESQIVSLEDLGMYDWPENAPEYSNIGLLVHAELFIEDALDEILDEQFGKDFYIPTASQIEELTTVGYEASSRAYRKLKSYLTKKHLDEEHAYLTCLRVWANSYDGESPVDIIEELNEEGLLPFDDEDDLQKVVNLLMNAHNNTRMMTNRGHKPTDFPIDFSEGFPTVVPGSLNAADRLREALPDLNKLGIPVDFDANADIIPFLGFPNGIENESIVGERKIYPNDMCPCGSGKKYKKCCGKR